MNKKVNVLIILSFLLVLVLGGAYTYSKYKTVASGNASVDVANWNILVNGCNITKPGENTNTNCFNQVTNEDGTVTITKNFSIEDFDYSNLNNQDVVGNKIAPGSEGEFKINIDPIDTEVSIEYTMYVTLVKENSSIIISRSNPNSSDMSVMETEGYHGILQYTSNGFVHIDDNGNRMNIDDLEFLIHVLWENNEENNSIDTEIGTSSEAPVLGVSVNIVFEQYLG